MLVERYDDVAEFVRDFGDDWRRNESENGAFLRMLDTSYVDTPVCLAVRNSNGMSKATACVFKGDQIILSRAADDAIEALTRFLVAESMTFPGIFAPHPTSTVFAEQMEMLGGCSFKIVKTLAHWELDALVPLRPCAGWARQAATPDRNRLIAWKKALQKEANTQRPVDPTTSIDLGLASGSLWVWETAKDIPTTMGAVYLDRLLYSGSIDGIYTHPDYRRKGAAAALVHSLCQLILTKKPVVTLSSDAAYGPANRLYQSLGFRLRCYMDNMRQSLDGG